MADVIWRVPNKQIETNSQLSALRENHISFLCQVWRYSIFLFYILFNSFSNKSHEKTKTPNALVSPYLCFCVCFGAKADGF